MISMRLIKKNMQNSDIYPQMELRDYAILKFKKQKIME